nr:MFS transporter [Sedimentibacter sp.]
MRIKLYSLIVLLNSFSTGLTVPVLSLLLIDKGASLSNISILMGIYSLTVVVFELPTGILADVAGRKKTFCISLTISIIGFSIIFISHGVIVLCFGIILYGLSRALSSGSFDALFIDSYIDEYGKDKLHNITTRLSILDSLGLSSGALAGGFLPKISAVLFPSFGVFDLNLIFKLLLTFIVAVLSILFIKENAKTEVRKHISIKQQIKDSSSVVMKNSVIKCILVSAFSTGFFLLSVETYWQPHFVSLLPDDDLLWLLGVITFLYFTTSILGSILSEKLIDKFNFNIKKMYIILRSVLASSVIVMSFQLNVTMFIVSYSLIYLFLGMANIPESVILNSEIPGEVRASTLSVNSLIFQLGALSGSFINSIIINYISIPSLWIIAAAMIFISILIIIKKFVMNRSTELCNDEQIK